MTFKGEILGAQKLNQRANKSLKDQHDHSGLEEMIQKKIRSNEVHPKGLSDIYEEVCLSHIKTRKESSIHPKRSYKSFLNIFQKIVQS